MPPSNPQRTPDDLGKILDRATRTPATEGEWVRLVERIAVGDQRALRELYDRTHRLVYTLANRITSSRESAEEVTLDVFQDVWERATGYHADGGTVLGWVMNQARSRAIDRLRFEQRKKRVPPADQRVDAEQTEPSGPADAMTARQQEGILREALRVLTPDERIAIETAFYSDLTYAETARKLGEPVGTVKTRVRSGLAKLRQALGGEAT